MMSEVMEMVRSVQDTAERIKSDETQFFPEAASVGDTVRQGDVYITLLKSVPRGAVKDDSSQYMGGSSLQLAPGTTQGSRHCLETLDGVTVYRLKEPNEYDGPILKLSQHVTITHPEHGDWVLPRGVYGISYQRTEDSERTIRRVQD